VSITPQERGTITKAVGRARGWLTLRTHHIAPRAWGWARSVVRWGTVILLLYVGFNTLYLKDPTFGNDGLVDYLALIAWGLGSDIAGQAGDSRDRGSGGGHSLRKSRRRDGDGRAFISTSPARAGSRAASLKGEVVHIPRPLAGVPSPSPRLRPRPTSSASGYAPYDCG
jgi:hypothetical protein